MASYSITTNSNEEAGITAAREQYNKYAPEDQALKTNKDYVSFILKSAFSSYQSQYEVGEHA